VNVGVTVGVGVGVLVAVGVEVGVGVALGVEVSVGVEVAVGVEVDVAVGVAVAVAVGVAVGGGGGQPFSALSTASTNSSTVTVLVPSKSPLHCAAAGDALDNPIADARRTPRTTVLYNIFVP
jgi:hypothetical protein